MAKKLNSGAFSLAVGYVDEIFGGTYNEEHYNKLHEATDLAQLKAVHENVYNNYNVEQFYNAMVKVNKLFRKTEKHLKPESREVSYGGTEDRGWWRVFGGIVRNDGYFCIGDLGRDQWMAQSFCDAGVITQETMNEYKTVMTLRMASDRSFMTNSKPDVDKIIKYWKPECVNQILDMGIIYALKLSQHNDVATLAMLAV